MTPTRSAVPSASAAHDVNAAALLPWMRYLLWFVGGYNILAGIGMMVFYHEGFRFLNVPKPELMLPLQIVGVMVALYGVGYWLTAWNPIENRNVLTLGFFSKLLGSILGVSYIVLGELPLLFLPILFFADIVYLAPFLVIMRRLYRLARENRATLSRQGLGASSRAA
jgi:small multidrug resistance pump